MTTSLVHIVHSCEGVGDCATCFRGYLGVTAHWIDSETLTRKSAALVCRRFKGTHTHGRIAQLLRDIHREFHIEAKIVGCTTDNGSNFVKAFR